MTLPGGRQAVIELAPAFAPKAVANILTLTRQGYFDGLSILRVQDNYVTQWGDPASGSDRARSLGAVGPTLTPEWTRTKAGLKLQRLKDGDPYAAEAGFVDGFPVGAGRGKAWLAHCYGMVGVGRDNAEDSGNGAELYAVIGHAPRHLDRNIALVGRVAYGMEHLAALPRGTGDLGFYTRPEERTPIESVKVAADLPGGGLAGRLERLRTDSISFAKLTESRRNRHDPWTKVPAGAIEVCNVMLPTRLRAGATTTP